MVQFIPPYCGEEIKSNAEKKMFDILQGLKCKNGYVLHSLGLPKHRSKIYGEIDFVVVCDRGVACLEIKGGRVACREGKWFFTDRRGVERQKPEGPFAQVIGREVDGQSFMMKSKIYTIRNLQKGCSLLRIISAHGFACLSIVVIPFR